MKMYRKIEDIRNALMESIETGEGVRVKATGMGSGSHHYWLTGDAETYTIHCYGSGRGWSDQGDDCREQDVKKISKKLYKNRKNIIENFC